MTHDQGDFVHVKCALCGWKTQRTRAEGYGACPRCPGRMLPVSGRGRGKHAHRYVVAHALFTHPIGALCWGKR